MVSFHCKNGANKGRLFWRCPYWQIHETCNLVILNEDLEEGKDVEEAVNEDGKKTKDLEAVEIWKEFYETSNKKNKKLEKNLKSEEFAGKWKLILIVFSFMLNMHLIMKCDG
ncbi:unnamed protein product [Lathyrus oleraceus]|uniref:Zinc finger GRF-type domain-containing protein n=1 Tax=Pisum sativum TaxID=3888 RepID=A0A9D4XDE4_PEA|nr:uncharacterized protein LOC127135355 [Pisum sativum]KAI5418332.1 hypothetical protein KIW84_042831 [Pisum sativum]